MEPAIAGQKAFGKFYATQRFNHVGLHAELVNRMTLRDKVIDHERISGVREQPFEVAVVYEVRNRLIQSILSPRVIGSWAWFRHSRPLVFAKWGAPVLGGMSFNCRLRKCGA